MNTYDFTISIGFRVKADSYHDALRAAIRAEESLNEAGFRASYGGDTTVIRYKAPTLTKPKLTNTRMPTDPSTRENYPKRYRTLLTPHKKNWRVTLKNKYGHLGVAHHDPTRTYEVEAATEKRAIERAKTRCYHETSTMNAELISVEAM